MDKQEIQKGNDLIKELMGGTIKIEQEDVKDIPLAFLTTKDLKFHLSWKWLMPVVIKIEQDLGHSVLIQNQQCQIIVDEDTRFESETDSKMDSVWRAIVEFLEWREG